MDGQKGPTLRYDPRLTNQQEMGRAVPTREMVSMWWKVQYQPVLGSYFDAICSKSFCFFPDIHHSSVFRIFLVFPWNTEWIWVKLNSTATYKALLPKRVHFFWLNSVQTGSEYNEALPKLACFLSAISQLKSCLRPYCFRFDWILPPRYCVRAGATPTDTSTKP